jgi:hypothetical protein
MNQRRQILHGRFFKNLSCGIVSSLCFQGKETTLNQNVLQHIGWNPELEKKMRESEELNGFLIFLLGNK